ncbi:MAG: carbohydrate kinase, partial [Muriicola sp.]|nr:carbohydrate kinase [Muriicola sp.]
PEASEVLHQIGAEIIAITLGAEGTWVSTKNTQQTIPSIPVNPVDTTGAGDAFIGCLLQQISQLPSTDAISENESQLMEMVEIANRAGALTTTGYGAIDSLPDKNQLNITE